MPATPPPPSEVLASRLLEFRNRHGWTQAELADRMTSYGWSWDRTTVAKIEARQRQVSVDEFVALSFVLGVPLAALVTPTASGAKVAITPKTSMTVPDAWNWFVGTASIRGRFGGLRHGEFGDDVITTDMAKVAVAESRLRFYEEARPDYFATAERRLPGISALLGTVSTVQSWLGQPGEHDEIIVYYLDHARDLTVSLLRKAKRKLATQRKSADNGRTNR